MYICVCIISVLVCAYVHVCGCVHMCIYVCMCVCVCMYGHTRARVHHVHTHPLIVTRPECGMLAYSRHQPGRAAASHFRLRLPRCWCLPPFLPESTRCGSCTWVCHVARPLQCAHVYVSVVCTCLLCPSTKSKNCLVGNQSCLVGPHVSVRRNCSKSDTYETRDRADSSWNAQMLGFVAWYARTYSAHCRVFRPSWSPTRRPRAALCSDTAATATVTSCCHGRSLLCSCAQECVRVTVFKHACHHESRRRTAR